jgi:feruloyl esterase
MTSTTREVHMKRSTLLLPLVVATWTLSAHADGRPQFTIQSLNVPDPIFTAGVSVPLQITSTVPAGAFKNAVVRLNGGDVTSSLSRSGSTLTGTVTGLVPGINTVEVFQSRGAKEPAARLKIAKAVGPGTACSPDAFSHAALPVANTVITSVTHVAATATVPAHCLVAGTIDANRVGYPSSATAPTSVYTYAIKWQVRLPDQWNSKFYMPGGGGLDGSIPGTTGNLALGYAEGANDSGHDNAVNSDANAAGTGSFATDYGARVNFAYRAIGVTTQTSKALIEAYYAKGPDYSYFQGCSQGGREALMTTQYLPEYFDGVVSGDPGLKLASMSTHEVYDAQVLAALAQQQGLLSSTGAPLAANTFTNQDLQLVSNAVLGACDALDGVADGMVANFHACTTRIVKPRLEALACTGAKTPACLLQGQIDALLKIYAGPPSRAPDGAPTYYGWMWDPGIAGCTSAQDCNGPAATNIATGWRSWKIGQFQSNPATAQNNALDFTGAAGGANSTVVAPTPPNLPAPTANEGLFRKILGYDLQTYANQVYATTAAFPISSVDLLDVDSPDRSHFRRHGGKLIVWQPQTGGPFSPLAMIDWYSRLNRFEGGNRHDFDAAQRFARLYMVPGSQHCGGGPSTTADVPANTFTSIVDWVENGNAPDSILATAASSTPWPGRTRPLCTFPAYARYNGTGDVDLASSFTCTTGHRHDEDGDHGDRGDDD